MMSLSDWFSTPSENKLCMNFEDLRQQVIMDNYMDYILESKIIEKLKTTKEEFDKFQKWKTQTTTEHVLSAIKSADADLKNVDFKHFMELYFRFKRLSEAGYTIKQSDCKDRLEVIERNRERMGFNLYKYKLKQITGDLQIAVYQEALSLINKCPETEEELIKNLEDSLSNPKKKKSKHSKHLKESKELKDTKTIETEKK